MSSRHPTHSFADLENWTAAPGNLGLFGFPVAHSLSPVMHHAALAALAREDARFATWTYAKFEIAPAQLGAALQLAHAKGFRGLNITVPHKEAVFAHAESADDFTRGAGAGNTLVRTATGWHATNTDGGGLVDALRAEAAIELRDRDVILLGAGGAARAAALQCVQEGARTIVIGNRSRDRLDALLAHLAPLAGATPLRGFLFDEATALAALPAGAIVINATSAGLGAAGVAPVDLRQLPRPAVVYDMTYNPSVTPLLRDAAALGLPHVNGLGMLAYQGARSLARWTGRAVPADLMLATLREARGETKS
jgi:shikimate dehydrogenase